jgi:uncharacterized iron-regulated membrane protein
MSLKAFYYRPQSVALRKLLFQVHLWVGIGVGLYVLVIGVSGAALVFRDQMQHALYPQFFPHSASAGAQANIADVVDNMKAAFPEYRLVGVSVPNPERHAFVGFIYKDEKYRAVFADTATGAVIGSFTEKSIILWLQNLHFYLLAGTTGLFVNGIGALLLLSLCITGLVIWWPGVASWTRGLKIDFRKNWKRVNWDLHNAVGFWTLAIVLMWAVTGAYLAFPQTFRDIVGVLTPTSVNKAVSSTVPIDAGAKPVDVHALVWKAEQVVPGSHVTRVSLPTTMQGVVQVAVTRTVPAARENADYVYLNFDQFSGDLLQTRDLANRTTGDAIVSWFGRLHVGSFGGLPIKILWLILGLAPALLFITGTIMWWNRVVLPRMRLERLLCKIQFNVDRKRSTIQPTSGTYSGD